MTKAIWNVQTQQTLWLRSKQHKIFLWGINCLFSCCLSDFWVKIHKCCRLGFSRKVLPATLGDVDQGQQARGRLARNRGKEIPKECWQNTNHETYKHSQRFNLSGSRHWDQSLMVDFFKDAEMLFTSCLPSLVWGREFWEVQFITRRVQFSNIASTDC